MLPIQNMDDSDKKFFQELDKHSTTLRHSAEKFADFLMKLKDQSAEIKLLIKSLDQITVSPIEKIDESIINLDKSLLSLNAKLIRPHALSTAMGKEELAEFLKYSQEISIDAAALSQKAIELNG